MKHIPGLIHFVSFWGFIAIKVSGHTFADWSWLWLFIPEVPFIGLFVQRLGL